MGDLAPPPPQAVPWPACLLAPVHLEELRKARALQPATPASQQLPRGGHTPPIFDAGCGLSAAEGAAWIQTGRAVGGGGSLGQARRGACGDIEAGGRVTVEIRLGVRHDTIGPEGDLLWIYLHARLERRPRQAEGGLLAQPSLSGHAEEDDDGPWCSYGGPGQQRQQRQAQQPRVRINLTSPKDPHPADPCDGHTMRILPNGSTLMDIQERGCVMDPPPGAPECAQGVQYFLPGGGAVVAPHFLACCVAVSASVAYRREDGEGSFYPESPPSFENVCGSSSVSTSQSIRDAVSAGLRDGGGLGGCNLLKRTRSAFGVCHELFTIHGNLTLRVNKDSGGAVSFKGARSVRRIFGALAEALGGAFIESCSRSAIQIPSTTAGRAPPSLVVVVEGHPVEEGGTAAGPHASATNNAGGGEQPNQHQQQQHQQQRVAMPLPAGYRRDPRRPRARVAGVQVRGAPPAPSAPSPSTGAGGVASIASKRPRPPPPPQASTGVETDTLYPRFFSVHMGVVTSCLGKRLSVACGRNCLETVLPSVLGPGATSPVSSLDDDTNSIKVRVVDWGAVNQAYSRLAGLAPCHGGGAVHPAVEASDNTTSVTARGAVIVRFSWDPPLPWDDEVEAELLEACRRLCSVIRGCC